MAANVSKWLKYAQAKLGTMVSASNDELDDLEAEQAARVADKPWLASDTDAPTLEETRARIEWEAEEQRRRAEAAAGTGPAATPSSSTASAVEPDPDVVKARLELDRQALESQKRLEAIRQELGVDPPEPT